jgi:hypothetical protein
MSLVKCPGPGRQGSYSRESCLHCHRVFSPGELQAKLAAEDRTFQPNGQHNFPGPLL